MKRTVNAFALLLAAAACLVTACDEPVQKSPVTSQAKKKGPPPVVGQLNTNPDANVSTQEAQAGVGKKGRGLDDVKGSGRIVSQPASTLFSFKEKAVFDIQIPQAMNLYRATHGNFPKSHKDFQTHIIKANNLRLPELESNQRYVYDPETQKLMVETQH